MDNIFLYLLGFAGTDKLTIARAFARSVGAKLVDNHWINNPIFGLIDPDGVSPLPDAVWSQTAKVREAVLETIATLAKPGTNFVFSTTASRASATTKTCREVSNQRRHAAAPGSSPSAWCVTRMNLYVASNRPIAQPCSNAPIPPMRSTRVATTPCSIQGCLGL
jgi:hypothetical protein